MIFNRDFLLDAHNDIEKDMEAIGFKPHFNKSNIISHNTYNCNFYTVRYWRSKDMEWMKDHCYNQSCLELVVCDSGAFVGIWYGINNKSGKDILKLKKQEGEILAKCKEYPGYMWMDEFGTPAPSDEKLIKWLCETNHETVFRKKLTSYNKDEVINEMKLLKEYLDVLL